MTTTNLTSDEREQRLSEGEWYDEVVRICKTRGYAEWFYADREAWLEDREEMTPLEAVKYQRECLQ